MYRGFLEGVSCEKEPKTADESWSNFVWLGLGSLMMLKWGVVRYYQTWTVLMDSGGEPFEEKKRPSLSWADCMKRFYEIDPLACPKCGSQMRIIAFLTDQHEIEKIMRSQGIAKARDGFLSPGPEVYLIARSFSLGPTGSKLLGEKSYSIGDMQYARLLAGEKHGRSIVFQIEGGKDFDTREVAYKTTWTLTVNEDNSLRMAEGKTIFLD